MDSTLSLNGALYAELTPAGAWYAVSTRDEGSDRQLLLQLLQHGGELALTETRLQEWCAADSPAQALAVLYRLQRLGFVSGRSAARSVPAGSLESRLPALLAALSGEGRALLADDNGLYYATAGFRHEAAEQIAALAGDIITLSRRHTRLLNQNLGLGAQAWALIDPAGQAELGFHPLYLGRQSFVLVIGGQPRLGDNAFVAMTEALCRRYA